MASPPPHPESCLKCRVGCIFQGRCELLSEPGQAEPHCPPAHLTVSLGGSSSSPCDLAWRSKVWPHFPPQHTPQILGPMPPDSLFILAASELSSRFLFICFFQGHRQAALYTTAPMISLKC